MTAFSSLYVTHILIFQNQLSEGLVMIRFENASDYADAAASYNDWVQSFINMHAAGCNIVSYDFSNQQLLAVRLSFY